jgi:expansin (peptidoglycan-binding protein)
MNKQTSFQSRAQSLNKVLCYCILVLLVVLAYAPPASAQTCTPAPVGLIAWWNADNNALDSRGRSNGALRNGTTFAAGQNGQAFSFDGVNDSIDTSAAPNPNLNFGGNNFTIEAWVNFTSTGGLRTVYGVGYSTNPFVLFAINASDRAEFRIRDNAGVALNVAGTTALNDGVWHHIAGVREGTTARLYVDGTQQGGDVSNPAFGSIVNICNFAFIGGFNSTGVCATPIENFFSGLIDEVSLYDRALSPTEIAAIHAAGTAGKCKPTATVVPPALPQGLVGWWAGDGNPNDTAGTNNG